MFSVKERRKHLTSSDPYVSTNSSSVSMRKTHLVSSKHTTVETLERDTETCIKRKKRFGHRGSNNQERYQRANTSNTMLGTHIQRTPHVETSFTV